MRLQIELFFLIIAARDLTLIHATSKAGNFSLFALLSIAYEISSSSSSRQHNKENTTSMNGNEQIHNFSGWANPILQTPPTPRGLIMG